MLFKALLLTVKIHEKRIDNALKENLPRQKWWSGGIEPVWFIAAYHKAQRSLQTHCKELNTMMERPATHQSALVDHLSPLLLHENAEQSPSHKSQGTVLTRLDANQLLLITEFGQHLGQDNVQYLSGSTRAFEEFVVQPTFTKVKCSALTLAKLYLKFTGKYLEIKTDEKKCFELLIQTCNIIDLMHSV